MSQTVPAAGPAAEAVTPQRLFEMMAGFKNTAVLRAGVELGVFDALADGPADARTITDRLGTDARGTALLLGALAGLGLLTQDGGDGERYGLAPGTQRLLVSDSAEYCGGITRVASSTGEWEALGRLADTVRTGGPVPGVDALAPGFPYWVDFATHTTFGTVRGADLLAGLLVPWAESRPQPAVLDVGCGHALFGLTMAQRLPQAQVAALDWPNVLEVAERNAERLGVRDRLTLIPGDARDADLGGPYDVVVVANLLFHFSPGEARKLVERLAGTLKPGGRLAVVGFTTGDAPAQAEAHAHLLGLLMLSWTEGGEMHSSAAYRSMLEGAGLSVGDPVKRPGLPLGVLIAERPAG